MSVRYLSAGLWPLTSDGTNITLESGQLLLPAGTAAAPSYAISGDSGTGWYRSSAGTVVFVSAGSNIMARFNTGELGVPAAYLYAWASGTNPTSDSSDLFLGRAAAANLRLGAAAANPPVAQTLSTQGASGTDIAGANFTVDVSQGTGTGAGGSFIVRTAAAGGTGSSQNALAAALTIDSTRAVIPAVAAITAGSGTGLTVNSTGELRRVTHKVTVTYAALAAAALTADKTIATLPAKTRLVGIVADTTTPYTGGGVTAATLIVGKSVGGNEYVVSHDVLTAAIVKGNADADLGTSINRANAVQGGDLPSWTGTTAVSVRLTTTTANTDQLTAGSTTYYLTTEVQP